jgi:hypothetical protein
LNKKVIYILIAILLLAGIFAAALYAGEEELSFALNSSGNGYTVTGMGTYRDNDVVIPDTYEGLPVTAIATRAFEQKTNITSVTMPDSITSIGEFSFSGCTSLKMLVLSDGLISMGKGAFYNCISLENVYLPYGLSVIGDWAFWNCQQLTSISIPNSISSIGIGAFSGCTRLSDVQINSSLSSLAQYLFADCIALKTITLPPNVASIGEYAFADCYNLSELFFQNSNVNINGRAFYGVEANAHYSCSDSSWSGFNFSNYGGTLTWISHTNVVHYAAVPATEESPGSIEYWYCSDCNRYFSDEACTKEISPGQIEIPILGEIIRGDVDGNGKKNEADVLRALYHLFFGDTYKVNQDIDFNGDGAENEADVLRLLYNIFFGSTYPLS